MTRTAGARGPHLCDPGRGKPKDAPLPPPEYFSDNATNATRLAANKTECTRPKTHNACLTCLIMSQSRLASYNMVPRRLRRRLTPISASLGPPFPVSPFDAQGPGPHPSPFPHPSVRGEVGGSARLPASSLRGIRGRG